MSWPGTTTPQDVPQSGWSGTATEKVDRLKPGVANAVANDQGGYVLNDQGGYVLLGE